MKLAVVTGQIVCTVRHHGLAHDKLLMVEMIDPQGNPDGQCAVAIDNIGAGTGESFENFLDLCFMILISRTDKFIIGSIH